MPQFPHSKYSANPASGVLVKQQGSHSPMVEADEQFAEVGFLHPYKVTVRYVDGGLRVFVRAGTVNNVVPEIDGKQLDDPTNEGISITVLDGAGVWYVQLQVTGESGQFFPETAEIIVATEMTSDTNSEGYLNLAGISFTESGKPRVNQFIYASQIAIRAKPGDSTAIWLFSSR